MGKTWKLEKGGETKGPAVWPNCTSYRIFFADYGGVISGRQEVRIFFGDPWTLETNFKPLTETSKEIVNMGKVGMIMQVRGKLREINRSGRGQL